MWWKFVWTLASWWCCQTVYKHAVFLSISSSYSSVKTLYINCIDHRTWFQTVLTTPQCHITVNTKAHVQVHFGQTPCGKSHAVIMQNEKTTTAVVMSPFRGRKQKHHYDHSVFGVAADVGWAACLNVLLTLHYYYRAYAGNEWEYVSNCSACWDIFATQICPCCGIWMSRLSTRFQVVWLCEQV